MSTAPTLAMVLQLCREHYFTKAATTPDWAPHDSIVAVVDSLEPQVIEALLGERTPADSLTAVYIHPTDMSTQGNVTAYVDHFLANDAEISRHHNHRRETAQKTELLKRRWEASAPHTYELGQRILSRLQAEEAADTPSDSLLSIVRQEIESLDQAHPGPVGEIWILEQLHGSWCRGTLERFEVEPLASGFDHATKVELQKLEQAMLLVLQHLPEVSDAVTAHSQSYDLTRDLRRSR